MKKILLVLILSFYSIFKVFADFDLGDNFNKTINSLNVKLKILEKKLFLKDNIILDKNNKIEKLKNKI